jgi:hypothetical protein
MDRIKEFSTKEFGDEFDKRKITRPALIERVALLWVKKEIVDGSQHRPEWESYGDGVGKKPWSSFMEGV